MTHRKYIAVICLSAIFHMLPWLDARASELRQTSFGFSSTAAVWKEDPAHVICHDCGALKALSHIPANYAERVIKIRTPVSDSVQFFDNAPVELKDVKENATQLVDNKPEPAGIMQETVFFDFDSAELKKTELEKIRKIIIPGASYDISGYTCAAGDEGYNNRLALRRAQSVYLGLMSLGVDSQHIKMGGKGKCCYADTDEKSGKNRRAEIILHKEGR
ncbi:MAG TPA: OmpA family protein [Geobacteraceae bacterium]|nr:OmpA family protein [Geobacteraceae bacterium]